MAAKEEMITAPTSSKERSLAKTRVWGFDLKTPEIHRGTPLLTTRKHRGKIGNYLTICRRCRLASSFGDASYPVKYLYDDYGRRVAMTTYRDSSIDFTGTTWPSAADSTGDTTTWNYHEASGLLQSKTDAAGQSTSYTYCEGGKLATRTWARNGGSIVTTYGYDPDTGGKLGSGPEY